MAEMLKKQIILDEALSPRHYNSIITEPSQKKKKKKPHSIASTRFWRLNSSHQQMGRLRDDEMRLKYVLFSALRNAEQRHLGGWGGCISQYSDLIIP